MAAFFMGAQDMTIATQTHEKHLLAAIPGDAFFYFPTRLIAIFQLFTLKAANKNKIWAFGCLFYLNLPHVKAHSFR